MTNDERGKKMRYKVENKAFKTGEWYTKTETDSRMAACSVAATARWGRAYRVTDTETGEIIKEHDEDASMAACNGYPR